MATMKNVAERAGVSTATVSRVLNGRASVDPELAERVRAAVEELGYRPNGLARNLRRQRSSLWAVMVSDIENPFFTSIVRGIEDIASAAGFNVVLCNSDEDPAKEKQYISALLSENMAGLIVAPTANHVDAIHGVVEAGCPVVMIDRRIKGLTTDSVAVDNEVAGQRAVEHLLDQGFERIACITGPHRLSTARARRKGYEAALHARGVTVDRDLIRHADFRVDGGAAAMAEILDAPQRPDAVFVTNNLMTIGALRCISGRGLLVPHDVAIAGFDALPWADFVTPTVTTVEQPTWEMGQAAGRLLDDRIRRPETPAATMTFETTLTVRDSSRKAG